MCYVIVIVNICNKTNYELTREFQGFSLSFLSRVIIVIAR